MARKSVARRKRVARTKKKKAVRRMEYAVIPECQDRSYADKEYTTSREEQIWDPKVNMEGWIPAYSLTARAVLTYKQYHEGIPNIEAIENSCSGVAEQYISDVLHECKYEPHEALRTIFVKDMPQKIIDKWKPNEVQHFTEGIMKYGKRFSIIRRELLPHRRVEDFADFYYVWKRSCIAEAWRKSRTKIEDKKIKKKKERLNSKPLCNLWNNIPVCNLSNDRIMTRRATAAARLALQKSGGIGDDSKASRSTTSSDKSEETSSATESADSSKEHVQKPENELPETASSEKSPMKNEQISHNSMKCPKQRSKRKLSIPRKIVNFEEECADETEEVKYAPAPIIPQWKRQRRCKRVVIYTRAYYQCDLQFLI